MLRRIIAISSILGAFTLGTVYAQEIVSDETDTIRGMETSINSTKDDDGFDTGWLGVLGLAGLGGLIPRDRRDRNDRHEGTAHTTAR